MEDKSLIESLLPECDTVIHLASGTIPGSSAGKPVVEADMNIVPTLKFLDIFRHCGNQRLIFVSSGGTLYGNPEKIPVNETHTLCPLSYHGAGKIAIEAFLQAFAYDSGKEVTILRPSNIYGPGQLLRQGFGFIRTVLEHLKVDTEMEIWGDGSIVRDFLYIGDMLKSIDAVINADPHTDVYNIGYGKGYSLNVVISTVEKVCGRTLKVKYLPARQVDVQRVVLDCSKIREILKWKPETSLEKGIELTWQWMVHH
jgi:UDP-glucose 4-epimerase